MEQETLNAINNTLTTMQNVGFGVVLAFVIVMMIFAYIMDRRMRSKTEDSDSKQNEQVLVLLAKAIDNKDTETAKAIQASTQTVQAVTMALNHNTSALESSSRYREMQVKATEESVNELKSLRTDIKQWPESTNVALDILTKSINELKSSMGLLIASADNRREDDSAVLAILRPIPAQLETLLRHTQKLLSAAPATPPGSHPVATPPPITAEDGQALLAEEKRKTDRFPAVKPDKKPDDAA